MVCQTERYLVVAKTVLQAGWPDSQVQHVDIHRSPGKQSLQPWSTEGNLQNVTGALTVGKAMCGFAP